MQILLDESMILLQPAWGYIAAGNAHFITYVSRVIHGCCSNVMIQMSYALQAVICHYGCSMEEGHYVAYVKTDDSWLSLDDNQVF